MTTYYARSFKELRVYQKAREVSQAVFRISKAFPKEVTDYPGLLSTFPKGQ